MSKENRIRKLMQRIAVRNEVPSADRAMLKSKLTDSLQKIVAARKPAQGGSAWRKVMGEELSSKLFYRQFKSRHANCNINEINLSSSSSFEPTSVRAFSVSASIT